MRISSRSSPPSAPPSHGWPSDPGWAPVLERHLPPSSDDPPPRGSPPPRTPASSRRPSRGSYCSSSQPSKLRGRGRGKPYNHPSPPAATTTIGPLGHRLTEGGWTTHLPPITHARRFFFYPAPDDISVADLREELQLRLGEVASLRVNEGLADVLFKKSQGARGLNFCGCR